MSDFIFTSQEEFWEPALEELSSILPDAKLVKWIDRGVGILRTPDPFSEISLTLQEHAPIYTRHIFPLDYTVMAEHWPEVMEKIAGRLKISHPFPHELTYNIQLRILDPSIYAFTKYELTQWMSEELQKNVFIPEMQNPDYVISGVLKDSTFYIGLSETSKNLSAWPGGMRRFAHYDGQISRAEFKLLEALEIFGIELRENYDALDLGAAPGGWTKVLTDAGLSATAVDPADLAPPVSIHPKVKHYSGLAQKFLTESKQTFDIIVNDMRCDVMDSVKIMLKLTQRLRKGGIIIMTFKLPLRKPQSAADKGLALLAQGFSEIRAKQLFHNRSEITVTAKGI